MPKSFSLILLLAVLCLGSCKKKNNPPQNTCATTFNGMQLNMSANTAVYGAIDLPAAKFTPISPPFDFQRWEYGDRAAYSPVNKCYYSLARKDGYGNKLMKMDQAGGIKILLPADSTDYATGGLVYNEFTGKLYCVHDSRLAELTENDSTFSTWVLPCYADIIEDVDNTTGDMFLVASSRSTKCIYQYHYATSSLSTLDAFPVTYYVEGVRFNKSDKKLYAIITGPEQFIVKMNPVTKGVVNFPSVKIGSIYGAEIDPCSSRYIISSSWAGSSFSLYQYDTLGRLVQQNTLPSAIAGLTLNR